MTLQDLEKIINAKVAFQGKKFEKYTTLTDKYLALTGITQLTGGKTIEQLFAGADEKEKEIIAGKLAWCIPGGKGMGGEDALKPQSEVDVETETYTAEEAAAYNAQLPGAKTTNDWKIEPVEAKEAQPTIYSFESYDSEEKTTKYGEGKVKVIEMRAGGATVEVTENEAVDPDAENFVGQQFNVATGLATDAPIQLYTLENEPVDIWVVVTLESEAKEAVEAVEGVKYTQEEADAYNAQLTGAVKAGDPIKND